MELVPYKNILSPFIGKKNVIDLGGELSTLTPQKERSVFKHKTHKIAPIICYESVYGNHTRGYVLKGADLFSIITNDGWWGNSQGHKQHLHLAKLRAIETRRTIVRSANTGVSAVINLKGDILKTIPYGKKDVLKANVNTYDKITFYVKYGDFIYKICFLLFLLLTANIFIYKKIGFKN